MSTSSGSNATGRTVSYAEAAATFDTSLAMAILSMDGGVHGNAAEICNERFASDRERIALRHRGISGETRDWTFADLKRRSSQFAHVLADVGVGKGDRVAGLLPRTPEQLITILAAWKLGAVYQPLFTAFGPKAIEHRLKTGETKVVVTDTVNRPKLTGLAVDTAIVTVGADEEAQEPDFWSALNVKSDEFASVPCAFEDPFLLMFTSGTTGLPKPLFVPICAIAAFVGYMRDAVGLREGDRFWNIADPGWAYGLYYAVVGPLAMGITTVFHEAGFTVDSTYDVIAEYGITNLAGSPTAYRLMVGEGPEKADRVKGQLKRVSSAGEPLNPEIIRWFEQNLEVAIYDHYGQTELGMVLCNHHSLEHPVHLGAAGYSVPGHRVVVLSPEGRELGPTEPGELALDVPNSPLMWFKGYHRLETPAFQGSYFLTGDTAEMNDDGSISFVGRADDVITTSGYRVGPFDVESALLEHPAVLDSAVIGTPDSDRTEIIKAFVVLKAGLKADDTLSEELQLHVKRRLSAHAYPRKIEFVDDLPKTPSGKVQRFLLRSQERAKSSPPA